MNTTTNDVPLPAGAEKMYPWHDVGTRHEGRYFNGRRWVIEGAGWHTDDIYVRIQGTQYSTGEVTPVITAGYVHPDTPITSAQARQLGRALIVADEYESLSDPEGTIR